MDKNVRNAIAEIVQYNYADELRDFQRMTRDGEETDSHIFRAIVTLENFLDGTTHQPEDYIEQEGE